MTQEINQPNIIDLKKARAFWSLFARRAQSSIALSLVAQAFRAMAQEMTSYEYYEEALAHQEHQRDYEDVLRSLRIAEQHWYEIAITLEYNTMALPPHVEKDHLIQRCLEQYIRVRDITTHMFQLLLAEKQLQQLEKEQQDERTNHQTTVYGPSLSSEKLYFETKKSSTDLKLLYQLFRLGMSA